MLWSETTSPAANDIGLWIFGLVSFMGLVAAILGCAVAIKKLLEPKRPEDTFVTQGELVSVRATFRDDVLALKELFAKHEAYVHTRFHDISNMLVALPIQVKALQESYEKLERKIEVKLDNTEHIVRKLERVLEKKPGLLEEP